MKKNELRLKRITINIPTKLYNEISKLASDNGLNFTSQTITLLRNGIDQSTAVQILPTILEQLLNEQNKPKKKKTK